MATNSSWRSGISSLKNKFGLKTHLSPASTERPVPSNINPSQFEAESRPSYLTYNSLEPAEALHTTSYNPPDRASHVQGSVVRSTIPKVRNPYDPSPIRNVASTNTILPAGLWKLAGLPPITQTHPGR